MMKRKFSLANIPLLNIGPSRPNERQLRDQLLSPTDSRPPTPRSVRPPLPLDVDAELRAACTYIVNHPKPSHQVWHADAPKPALDYAAVKYDADHSTGGPVRKPSTRSRSAAPRHETAVESSKYGYKPNVATEELFSQDERERAPGHIRAMSRVDQLMAPEPVKVVTTHAPPQIQSPPSQEQPQLAPMSRNETSDKKRISTRSDSVGTTGSTPHTDTTDYPWSASTPMTSAAITPARGSKRASSQNITGTSEAGSVPNVEPVNGDWMRAELEKHKKAMEERDRAREKERQAGSARRVVDSTPIPVTVEAPAPVPASRVPLRKPVPTRPESRQEKYVPQEEVRQGRSTKTNRDYPPLSFRGRSKSSRPVADRAGSDVEGEERGRGMRRSRSRLSDVSRAASRAASKAGNITNDIISHYLLPGTNQNSQAPVSPNEIQRSPSRARNISTHIKEYMKSSRPGTSMGSRKHSMDTGRGHMRTGSTDSLHSSASRATESSSRWKNWYYLKRNQTQTTTPDMSRPGSSGSAIKTQRQSPPKSTKPPIDLNRELPPLPGLDQWKAEEAQTEHLQPAPLPSRATTPYSGLKRALSRRRDKGTISPAPQAIGKTDAVAARLGSPTPPRSQKQSVDVQRFELGYPSPPVSLSPDMQSLDPRLGQLSSLSRSTTPQPNSAPRHEQRIRSKSNQSGRPDIACNGSTASEPYSPQAAVSPNLSYFPQPLRHGTPVTGKRRSDMKNAYATSSGSVNASFSHSRTSIDKMGATRKYSVDGFNSADKGLHHQLATSQLLEKDKSRRKWWQGKDKHQHANYMDQITQSGARNGIFIDDEGAEPPVIHY